MRSYEDSEKAVFESLEQARKFERNLQGDSWTLVFYLAKALVLAILTIAQVLDERP